MDDGYAGPLSFILDVHASTFAHLDLRLTYANKEEMNRSDGGKET